MACATHEWCTSACHASSGMASQLIQGQPHQMLLTRYMSSLPTSHWCSCAMQVDTVGCCFVVTTGGTGPAPRDNTPEATEAVCSKLMPGFGEKMRSISLKYVPTAILSRQTAGIRGSCLILNLPGSPKSIREILDEIFSAVPYCVDLVGGPYMETNTAVVSAFRPVKDRRAPKQGA